MAGAVTGIFVTAAESLDGGPVGVGRPDELSPDTVIVPEVR